MFELGQWQAHLRAREVALRSNGAFYGHPGTGAVSVYFDDPWGTRLEITSQGIRVAEPLPQAEEAKPAAAPSRRSKNHCSHDAAMRTSAASGPSPSPSASPAGNACAASFSACSAIAV